MPISMFFQVDIRQFISLNTNELHHGSTRKNCYGMSPLNAYHPRYWPTWLGIGGIRALNSLPLPVLLALGTGVGDIVYRTYTTRRRIALTNLKLCFPGWSPDKRAQVARQNFRLIGQSALTAGMNWWGSEDQLAQRITTQDRHYYDVALQDRRNVILLAPHFVALEIGGLYLSRERMLVSMYQRTKNPVIDGIVRRGRSRFGARLVERKADLRTLVREIRSGKPFYYLPDQDAGRKGLFVPFFGVPTSTFPSLSRFARLSNAAVIPCFTRQLPRSAAWEITFEPPLKDFPSDDEVRDTTVMNQTIEAAVRRMPEQYFWVHKRFKTRPPGDPDIYG